MESLVMEKEIMENEEVKTIPEVIKNGETMYKLIKENLENKKENTILNVEFLTQVFETFPESFRNVVKYFGSTNRAILVPIVQVKYPNFNLEIKEQINITTKFENEDEVIEYITENQLKPTELSKILKENIHIPEYIWTIYDTHNDNCIAALEVTGKVYKDILIKILNRKFNVQA